VGNRFGTDVRGIIASAESERTTTTATTAHVAASANRLTEASAYAEALSLLDRTLRPTEVGNASLAACCSDPMVT